MADKKRCAMNDPTHVTPEQIDAVLGFLPLFEQPGVVFGEWQTPQGQMPYYAPSRQVLDFVQALYDEHLIVVFDWGAWQEEVERYRSDPQALAEADLLTVRKLLTAHVRKDRFVEGHLGSVFESGHMTAILRRMREIVAPQERNLGMTGSALIATFSQTGTTTRIAERIAAGLRASGWQVDLLDISPGASPDLRGYDLLGIGTPTYFYRPPFIVRDFAHTLPALDGLASFVFCLHGTHQGDCGNQIRAQLRTKGTRDLGYFLSFGADYWQGYLRQGVLFSPDAPTEEELAEAEVFGGTLARRYADPALAVEPYDPPTPLVYALERALTSRPLARLLYSRTFYADAQCNSCGTCVRKCPVGNITFDTDKRPRWHTECLLCTTCAMACPQEAIHSAVDWPIVAPILRYNVWRGKKTYPYARLD